MIGSKVILTYKRKRLSLRPGLGFENECPDQSPRCQTLEASKTSVTEEIDSKHESERKDPEILNQCVVNNGGSSLLQCECCHCLYDVQGLLPSDEHLEVKKLCSSCVKRQNHLSSCEDTAKEKKTGFPLITFSRRSKHKKTVEKYGLVAAKGSNSSQEKKTNEDVDLRDVHLLSVPKIEISETLSGEDAIITEKCIALNDATPSLTEQASGTSPMDAISPDASLKDKQPEASECHVSAVVDESRIVSSDGLESSPDKIRDGGSLASFDLSKPPPEASGSVDCNLTLESSSNVHPDNNVSETHRNSTDSTSRSHSSTVEFPSQGNKVLELLDDKIGETSLSHVPARLFSSSTHLWGVDLPSVSIGQSQTSKNNFLQLFPEDVTNNTLPLKNPLQETSNGKHLHFRSSASSFNLSSLLPTQPNNIYLDTKTRELMQYPSDSVSLMRHKMMLDNIISKARAVSSIRKSNIFYDNFDPPVFSEEELDCLWIGVRRHGVGNWDAMLRDHRLQFATWRAPHELAQRWEQEQSKLLTTNSPCRKKRFRPTIATKLEEPQLSLGSSNFQNGPREKSTLVNANNGNLPHWLREAVYIPNPISTCVSYTGHSGMMQWINQPFSGSNRTMGIEPALATRCPAPPELVGLHQCRPISKPDDVIVINSDASSEETISDDHSVRH